MDAKTVKELRDKTNAGMMDCKKALQEANGDLDKAVEILRKSGAATAAKKAGREAKEGAVDAIVASDGKSGVIAEINCETDFVSRNENFQALVSNMLEKLSTADASAFADDKIVDETLNSEVQTMITDAVSTIGENLIFKRAAKFETQSGCIGSYIHMGGKIGVMVELEGEKATDELLKDVAMQIAATSPEYLVRDEIPQDILDKEKEIIKSQLTGKPENIIDKIVQGKLEKFYENNCLVDQVFVKDQDKKVKDILGDVKITRFVRYQLGA